MPKQETSQTVLMGISGREMINLLHGRQKAIIKKLMPKLTVPPYEIYLYITQPKHKCEVLYMDTTVSPEEICLGNAYEPNSDEVVAGREVLNGRVIGKCKCYDYQIMLCSSAGREKYHKDVGMTVNQLLDLCGGKDMGVWYVSDVELLPEIKTLNDYGQDKPPQNWCYLLNGEIK